MASFAKESLSPLLKNTNVRRRSLEICQQIGNALLSPNTTTSVFFPSPTKLSVKQSPKNKDGASPFKLLSPVFTYSYESSDPEQGSISTSYHYKRRVSDSLWIDTFSKEAGLGEKSTAQERRRSLTSQTNSLSLSLTESPKNLKAKIARIDSPDTGKARRNESGIPMISCNVIPPTPLKSEGIRILAPVRLFPLGDGDKGSGISDSNDGNGDDDAEKFDINENRINAKETSSRGSPMGVKYDLDERLIEQVKLNWDLCLKPDELLGKGSFGTVVGGLLNGNEVAVKVLKTTNQQRRASVLGEENAMQLPFHEHIARIMEILPIGTDQTLIVMEKMERGNLLALLNDPTFEVDSKLAIKISKEIALALVFCHRQGLLHLDVKPQNILVDLRNCCKLSDFGNSKRIANLDSGQKYARLEGTVPYTAPELFLGLQPTEKCDVYSFGVTMWQVLTREIPYENENEHSVIFRVVSQGLRPNDNNSVIADSSEEKNVLVGKYSAIYKLAWSATPDSRPPMTDIHRSLLELQFVVP